MLLGRRPSEIARWPDWEVRLIEHFLAREPSAMDRVEIALATLISMFARANFQGAENKTAEDFLPFLKTWPDDVSGRYTEAERETIRVLMSQK